MRIFSVRRLASTCAVPVALAAALGAPGVASAAKVKVPPTQCSGTSIAGEGSSLQKLAQELWKVDFNTSKNAKACSGTQGTTGKPTLSSYNPSGSGKGLESWGVNGHKFEAGRIALATTDEPVNSGQKAEIESDELVSDLNAVQSVPVLQGAVALIVNLPANCVATSSAAPGRLVLNNVTLEAIWHGTITKWSQITDGGDSVSGAGCNSEEAIKKVVRLDSSGTTHIFKKYLGLISTTKFETEKAESKNWDEISEGAENQTWPAADSVIRPAKEGGGALVTQVAETASSIGYANMADARSNGNFDGLKSGGPGSGKFWVEVQNSGVSTKKATYADPATNGDEPALGNANCEKEKYTNGAGTKFPPESTSDTWNTVTTETKQKKYPLCGLTYDMVLNHYGDFPETTSGEAQTAHDYLLWVLETKAEGGQTVIVNHDYEPLPKKIVKEAVAGASLAAF